MKLFKQKRIKAIIFPARNVTQAQLIEEARHVCAGIICRAAEFSLGIIKFLSPSVTSGEKLAKFFSPPRIDTAGREFAQLSMGPGMYRAYYNNPASLACIYVREGKVEAYTSSSSSVGNPFKSEQSAAISGETGYSALDYI